MSVVSEPESSSTAPGAVLTGTVLTPRQVRILKIAVIVMGVLLVGGFAFVLAAIVYQASHPVQDAGVTPAPSVPGQGAPSIDRSEEHTSELQSLRHLVCRLLLEKKKNKELKT